MSFNAFTPAIIARFEICQGPKNFSICFAIFLLDKIKPKRTPASPKNFPKDFKTIKMFEQCAWSGTGYACDLKNSNVLDSAMYLGRIQINLNGGKKRKYLYFQADFRPKMNDGGG